MNNDFKSIEALKAYAREVLCGNNPTNSVLIRMFDEIIDNAPSPWIPITMRPVEEDEKTDFPDATFIFDCHMPEDGEEILITTKYGVEFDTCYNDDGYYFDSNRNWDEVIAWMPKPGAYEKGGVEE